jgi:hypothetical protein
MSELNTLSRIDEDPDQKCTRKIPEIYQKYIRNVPERYRNIRVKGIESKRNLHENYNNRKWTCRPVSRI